MKAQVRIALVGDYNPQAVAHQAIPVALQLTAAHLDIDVQPQWLPTETLTSPDVLQDFDAIWVVPGSPYCHDDGAFMAIRHARETTCRSSVPAAAFSTPSSSTPAT